MMTGLNRRRMLTVLFAIIQWPATADAQTLPWQPYRDPLSGGFCDVINASNAGLVVSMITGELIIVSGDDIVLNNTLVDDNGFVIFEGGAAGVIGFFTDGDGQRTLWWTTLTGQVIRVNGFTGAPEETDMTPADFDAPECDACPLWDDPDICEEPVDEEPPEVTINLCGTSTQVPLGLTAAGLVMLSLSRRRFV